MPRLISKKTLTLLHMLISIGVLEIKSGLKVNHSYLQSAGSIDTNHAALDKNSVRISTFR